MVKKGLFIAIILIISGLSGIVADRYLFPRLASTRFFEKYAFLKKSAENVTVINKTEQVYIKEDTTVAKIAAQMSSSVVGILSTPKNEPKNFVSQLPKPAVSRAAVSGTGVIATSDGLIMTYLGAILSENASYKVIMPDRAVYGAELAGIDRYSNLAFLKISASNLPVVSFSDSANLKPGDKVVAVGAGESSFGNRVASGTLSGFDPAYNLAGKTVSSSEKLEGVFETDISLKADYVGAPLIDYASQTVGMVGSVEIDGKTDYFQIPSSKIKAVLEKAIRKELGENPFLGIYYLPIAKSYALAHNLPSERGALIFSPSGQQGLAIIAGSPAEKAGLKIGDIITKIGPDEVSPEKSLSDLLYQHKKGEEIELTIFREGKEMKVKVQL